ncbi:MAG TPA: MFS transporter, partial [Vicinamibacterales bacterium]|nr:MFS transporter [Vicinamibacterales bacterium]
MSADVPWYRTVTREQWRVLLAAKFGWMLDAMDFMLYTMAVGQLRMYFGFGDDTAGMLGTVTLVMSGVGGTIFGYVADRFGRTRALMGTILIFSLASLGAATSQSVMQLLFWRAVLGIGMGGEWASGAVLVSETWPAHLRNKAISIMQSGWALGYMMASISAAIILGSPSLGADAWRWLFVVGVVPAFFTLWIRRYVHEPETWTRRPKQTGGPSPFAVIFGPTLLRRTLLIIALGSAVQFANWGLFFWLPTFLARPVAQGGAGMGVVGSLPWIIPVQLGAYFGYLTFGFIADKIGRRQAFVLYMVGAALLVPIYGQMARSPFVLLALGPLIGYFGYGYFSMFGGFVAELYPAAVR